MTRLRTRQKLGKYRIERRLAEGGFATVYGALDTVEGIRVALKILHARLVDETTLAEFRKEVRITAQLDHPGILPIKNADVIEGRFVIAYPLGECSLAERLRRRISTQTALDFGQQTLEALAHAHRRRVIHCDVKPDNLILFGAHQLRLTDFGISKLALRTVNASGAGTLGYMAPEQAMGRPSFRSDVFSAGLIIFRMLTGRLPQWPFEWPPEGVDRLRRKVRPELIEILRKALELDARRRFGTADSMLGAFRRVRSRALQLGTVARPRRRRTAAPRDWQLVRRQQFRRHFGKLLQARHTCPGCEGPVAESMQACPWCSRPLKVWSDTVSFPSRCSRCKRGMKLDWSFCPWCFGPRVREGEERAYTDRRYSGRCANPQCSRKLLMPFMRYCPWCRRKVRRPWPVPESKARCPRCRWGVYSSFWETCPWCRRALKKL